MPENLPTTGTVCTERGFSVVWDLVASFGDGVDPVSTDSEALVVVVVVGFVRSLFSTGVVVAVASVALGVDALVEVALVELLLVCELGSDEAVAGTLLIASTESGLKVLLDKKFVFKDCVETSEVGV